MHIIPFSCVTSEVTRERTCVSSITPIRFIMSTSSLLRCHAMPCHANANAINETTGKSRTRCWQCVTLVDPCQSQSGWPLFTQSLLDCCIFTTFLLSIISYHTTYWHPFILPCHHRSSSGDASPLECIGPVSASKFATFGSYHTCFLANPIKCKMCCLHQVPTAELVSPKSGCSWNRTRLLS